jgi:hypothetical protein
MATAASSSAFVERRESEAILGLPRSFSVPEWVSSSAADAASGVFGGIACVYAGVCRSAFRARVWTIFKHSDLLLLLAFV